MFPPKNNGWTRWCAMAAMAVAGAGFVSLIGFHRQVRQWPEGKAIAQHSHGLIAHQVEIAGDVGGTIHIEPNDTPKAGEATLAWFALTKRGGEAIPLADCDCHLDIYHAPYTPGDTPFSCPDLRAVSAEGFEGIPGADVVFPNPGSYDLVVTGTPSATAEFEPFELIFSVTVAR